MNTTTPITTVGTRSRQLLAEVRDELRERREARTHRRVLERELATYTTRSEVDDILTLIRDESGADADLVRGILNRNLLAS
jgi:hypothetical protein